MRPYKLLIWIQATYTLLTALWPLIDIETFMAVTGPKTDVWLVKTVGALLIPVALCLYAHLRDNNVRLSALVLGMGVALAFICIDLFYALNDIILNIYLLDALVELIFVISWIAVAIRLRSGGAHVQ